MVRVALFGMATIVSFTLLSSKAWQKRGSVVSIDLRTTGAAKIVVARVVGEVTNKI